MGEGKQIKRSGGPGQHGHVIVSIRPAARDSGLVITDCIVGATIPKQFIGSVRKGIEQATKSGPLAGAPLVDFEVDIVGGSYHDVDSNDLAFQIAGSFALKDAVAKARPIILEPIMAVECYTPTDGQGDIIGDLNRRRGRIKELVPKGELVLIVAEVPLSEMFGYANAIRSLSKGRATYDMTPSHFEPVPRDIGLQIQVKSKG